MLLACPEGMLGDNSACISTLAIRLAMADTRQVKKGADCADA